MENKGASKGITKGITEERTKGMTGRELAVVGLTLFSMFFGAGNLIFPPYLAARAGTAVWGAMAGFLASAVGLPVLGVIAVSRSGGLDQLAGRVHPVFASVFTILIYLSIGPCLAIPRTASTSFEMTLLPLVREGRGAAAFQLAYSFLFFLLAAVLALHPEKLTQRLGKILSPALLCLILALFLGSFLSFGQEIPGPAAPYLSLAPVSGFLEGYQTMDTIAALNFGIVIALNIRALGVEEDNAVVKAAIKSGLAAGALLASVYAALAFVGIMAGPEAQGMANGANVLTFIAGQIFGGPGKALLGLIFFIACLNTCVGLLSCCSQFFCQLIPAVGYRKWVAFFALISVAVANAGLSRILAFSVPVLNGIYPVAMALIFLSFLPTRGRDVRGMYRLCIVFTGAVSLIYALGTAQIRLPTVTRAMEQLPGYELGLGWILPGILGAVLGWGISGRKSFPDVG